MIKVFFTAKKSSNLSDLPILPLEQLETFVRQRIHKYLEDKYEAWTFFDSPLLQFFIQSEVEKIRKSERRKTESELTLS